MTIYISHPTTIDYKNDLYHMIRSSELNSRYEFILPHESSSKQYNTKELFASGKCDLVIAECSAASTGQGIELGWANVFNIPIIAFYQKDQKPSGAVKVVANQVKDYSDRMDLIMKISKYLQNTV